MMLVSKFKNFGISFKVRCLQNLGYPAELPEDGYHGEYLISLPMIPC